jgi:hypothetical protein
MALNQEPIFCQKATHGYSILANYVPRGNPYHVSNGADYHVSSGNGYCVLTGETRNFCVTGWAKLEKL